MDVNRALEEMQKAEQMKAAQAEISQGARTFQDDQAILDYGRTTWNHDIGNLPQAQKDAISNYTHGHDQDINGALRGLKPSTPEVAQMVRELDRALAAHPVPEDVVVSRGIDLDYIDGAAKDMKGQTFTEQGFMSTTPGEKPPAAFASKEAILHLKVPAGTPGAWVEAAGEHGASEMELLLGQGRQWRADEVIIVDGKVHVYGSVL
jgi:hypothetical protein